jgi:hypothetical protein
MRRAVALSLALFGLDAAQADAGEIGCSLDNGAIIVPAALGDIAGDFILDLSASKSELHLTRSEAEGLATSEVAAPLRLAGETIAADFSVVDLDARSRGFPTTINGLIGADSLKGYVIDLALHPCRLRLSRGPTNENRGRSLPVRWIDGTPAVWASITDGRTGLVGWFAIDTGAAGVRVSTAIAHLSRSSNDVDATARSRPPARLAALGFAGRAFTNVPAALESDLPAPLIGGLGAAVWSHYDVRLDLMRDRLRLLPVPPGG